MEDQTKSLKRDVIKNYINQLDEFELNALKNILWEYNKAKIKHPHFPQDSYKAVAIITEEVGELAQAILDEEVGKKCVLDIQVEAAQVGAMGLRFLANSIWNQLPF